MEDGQKEPRTLDLVLGISVQTIKIMIKITWFFVVLVLGFLIGIITAKV